MEHLREMGNGWSQEFWVKILQIASSSTVLLFSTQNERKLTKEILDINQCHILFEYYLNATLWNKINRLVCNQYSFYLLIIAKRIFIFTGHLRHGVKYIVQYGELFPQCVYCFLMKRCWQPAYNKFFQGNSNKTIFVASYFPACQFQFMRTKKSSFITIRGHIFWAWGHCSYVPLFIVHRALLGVWLVSTQSVRNQKITIPFPVCFL